MIPPVVRWRPPNALFAEYFSSDGAVHRRSQKALFVGSEPKNVRDGVGPSGTTWHEAAPPVVMAARSALRKSRGLRLLESLHDFVRPSAKQRVCSPIPTDPKAGWWPRRACAAAFQCTDALEKGQGPELSGSLSPWIASVGMEGWRGSRLDGRSDCDASGPSQLCSSRPSMQRGNAIGC
jgi:hypothetical protein